MPKDYYMILGVSRGADLGQIKKAHRQIAKKYHPDLTRSETEERFRELQEAYETLADVDKRKRYDVELQKDRIPVRSAGPPASAFEPASHFHSGDRFESLLDEFFEGIVPGFFGPQRFNAPRKDLYFEVILSPFEAFQGGLFPIKFTVFEKCTACRGSGHQGRLVCPQCAGHGGIESEREFSLSIPPRTVDGTRVTLSMEDIGLRGVDLHVLIQVDPLLDA